MVNLDSKTQSEIDSVCNKGVSQYISKKHQEEIRSNLELGLLGSFIGSSLLFGLSKINNNIKQGYILFPASLGIISGSILSLINYNKNDEVYEQDFNEVCNQPSKDKTE